ncbi:MAG: hypothetical protein ABSB86_18705 [Bryobacteraceae bacterium]|jgi:hypothetical protein
MKSFIGVLALLFGAIGCLTRLPLETPRPLSPSSPRILRFIARPQVIHAGEKVTLTWNAGHAEEVLLEEAKEASGGQPAEFLHSVGKFPASGSLEVWPKVSTTYVVSCGDETIGCASASATVVVK